MVFSPSSFQSLIILFCCFTKISSTEDRYSWRIPGYKLTVPRKVSEGGTFISHYLPHFYNSRRQKRDLYGEVVSYIIPVDDEELLVQLWPYSDFLSPGLVTEHHSMFAGNKSQIRVRGIRDLQCHYRGIVKGIENSRVAMSTCYGLAGHVVTPSHEFFIEPSLDETRSAEYHKHYIYKRGDVPFVKHNTNCGTKGKYMEAIKERLDWENKYGKKIEESITSNVFDNALNFHYPSRNKRDEEICSTEPPPPEFKCLMRTPHFLEVMVTVDAKLDKYVFYDLETFILTIFNMVAANFHDGSIGETIHVKVVRIVYLTNSLPRLDVARFSPSDLLQNFCDWQLELNPLRENHPNHHDFAVFISRFEHCNGGILGLANMASICRLDKSCTVVSEEGLLLANIITHQIGHSFGAEHDDGDTGGCVGEDADGTRYHMSPLISSGSTTWSLCSQQSIGTFIKSRMSWCLADRPREHDYSSPDILPGQVYDAIQQCTLNFNMRTLACGTGDFCKELYCQISPTKCATTGDPPAAGTPCAKGMWCFRGDCVQRGQRPGSIDGEWGPWASWSPCTRTCGGGVQSRFRMCDNPPPLYGGRYCIGSWISHKMCNTRPCVGFTPSFWDIQCKMTNKRPYRGRYFLWDHFKTFFEGQDMKLDMKCILVCINERNQVSIRSPVVIDGTPCQPGTNNVCIGGECRRVGCDFVIDSRSKDDMCGKCHGSGTGCKIVQGCFKESELEGIESFLKLPEGTAMIFIRELDASTCYLVISSPLDKAFYLNNPESHDQFPGEFTVAGVSGVYDESNTVERVFIKNPIKTPITISARCTENGTMKGYRFQYALPEENQCYIPTYKWEYLYWDECTKMCGGGVQRARPSCVEIKGGEVEDKYCYDKSKPVDLMRFCNNHPCVAKWWVGAWSNCDCKDGEGIMTRLVFCMKPQKEDYSLTRIVKDKECSYQPKPRMQKPCSIEKDAQLFAMQRGKREPSYEYEDEEVNESKTSESGDVYLDDPQITTVAPNQKSIKPTVDKKKSRKHLTRDRHQQLRLKKKRMTEVPVIDHIMKDSQLFNTQDIEKGEQRANKRKHSGIIIDNEQSGVDSVDTKVRKNIRIEVVPSDNEAVSKPAQHSQSVCEAISVLPLEMSRTPSTAASTTSSTECNVTKYLCTMEMKCGTTDFFFEHVFTRKLSTTCSPEDSGVEPADLGPRLESTNNSIYKLFIVPIAAVPGFLSKTDIGLATFGDSIYFPPGVAFNQTPISGDNIFRILQEARRRATKPPIIDVDSE